MEKILFRFFIVTSTWCWCTKYVFVENQKGWSVAREHCKNHYTDYVALTNEDEKDAFKTFVHNNNDKKGWIGLYFEKTGTPAWKWSGGEVFKNPTSLNLPETDNIGLNIYWNNDTWSLKSGDQSHSFFCINMVAAKEEKTWEDALETCRKNHTTLTSLLSLTEIYMANNETKSNCFSQRVWIGLRFLGDQWMWVNGDPLNYTAWSQGGDEDPQCPTRQRCAALTKDGLWESRDCQEKLSFICA